MKHLNNIGQDFYRNLLNNQAKYFYDTIIAHFMSKNYYPIIHMNIQAPCSSSTDCFAAYRAVRNDYPELFFLGTKSKFSRTGKKGILKCSILYTSDEIERVTRLLRRFIYQFVRGTAYKPQIEQERIVYERIAKRLRYFNNNDVSDHNIVAPLLKGTGVCEGFTSVLLLCLRRLQIPCIKVTGKSESGALHSWVIAEINNCPVHLDVTWDSNNHIVPFDYYNLSDKQINADHSDYYFSSIPCCISDNLNYFRTYKCSFFTKSELDSYIFRNRCFEKTNVIYLQINYAKSYKELCDEAKRIIKKYGKNDTNYEYRINDNINSVIIKEN